MKFTKSRYKVVAVISCLLFLTATAVGAYCFWGKDKAAQSESNNIAEQLDSNTPQSVAKKYIKSFFAFDYDAAIKYSAIDYENLYESMLVIGNSFAGTIGDEEKNMEPKQLFESRVEILKESSSSYEALLEQINDLLESDIAFDEVYISDIDGEMRTFFTELMPQAGMDELFSGLLNQTEMDEFIADAMTGFIKEKILKLESTSEISSMCLVSANVLLNEESDTFEVMCVKINENWLVLESLERKPSFLALFMGLLLGTIEKTS